MLMNIYLHGTTLVLYTYFGNVTHEKMQHDSNTL